MKRWLIEHINTPKKVFFWGLGLLVVPSLFHVLLKITLLSFNCRPILEMAGCLKDSSLSTVSSLVQFVYAASWFVSSIALLLAYVVILAAFIFYIVTKIKQYKNGTEAESKKARTVLLVVFAVGLIFLMNFIWASNMNVQDRETSVKNADAIRLIKLQKSDVDGTNLPSGTFDQNQFVTIEGVDANNNHIRDDVELALFAQYPIVIKNGVDTNFKERAAALQYAQAMQVLMTKVNSKEEMSSALEKWSNSVQCLKLDEVKMRIVEKTQLNTQERTQKKGDQFENYMTSYGSEDGPECAYENF
jgi:uncharacterized membrane protein